MLPPRSVLEILCLASVRLRVSARAPYIVSTTTQKLTDGVSPSLQMQFGRPMEIKY